MNMAHFAVMPEGEKKLGERGGASSNTLISLIAEEVRINVEGVQKLQNH